jgi:glycolate oxidase|tara:strand:- start:5361 stop:6761 length:1401 start_codon:yes stop_codon:yes gene_type:complete
MSYNKVSQENIDYFASFLQESNMIVAGAKLEDYSHDYTEDLRYFPEIVLKPVNTQDVSKIVSYCNENKIPVTPCGARTGLSGGSLPVCGGIAMSMERFTSIIEIDERNLQATVEPGVINQVFKDAVSEKGLYYPPDPASKGSSFLGGNLAENSGGPKALKYGVTKDYVLNLEVVLPTGEIIWTGANVLKNSTGYNLTQLMIGSEGTLGVITKIVFRLIPHPTQDVTMLVPFKSTEKACEAVSAVFRAGITPSALEFMEREAIDWAIKFSDESLTIDDEIKAHLLVEVDGNDMDVIFKDCEKIAEVMEGFDCSEILFADTAQQKNQLWSLRRSVGEAVKSHSIYKEEDTVVPRAELPKLLSGVKVIGEKFGFNSVCYGHAGDGNLHINIIKGDMSDDDWNNKLNLGIREIFELTVSLGGTLSGEHGIGWVQKQFMDIAFSEKNIEIQKGIKRLFDPNNILNPDKMFN